MYSVVSSLISENKQNRYPRRCASQNTRNWSGENREPPTPRSKRKIVEAEECDGCANCDRRSIRSCISDMFEIWSGELNVTIRVKTPVGPLGALWFAPIVIGQAV